MDTRRTRTINPHWFSPTMCVSMIRKYVSMQANRWSGETKKIL